MNYAFNPALFKALFQTTIDDYRDHFQFDENSENSPDKLIIAMNQAVDVMERADSDKSVKAGNQSPLEASGRCRDHNAQRDVRHQAKGHGIGHGPLER